MLHPPPFLPAPARSVHSANGYHVVELDSHSGVWDFVSAIRKQSNDELIFRGQNDARHPLETSLTRVLRTKEEHMRKELRREHMKTALFELRGRVDFQGELADCLDALSRSVELSISSSHGTPRDGIDTQIEVEFWSFCQHYGLATPLLDWSFSPGVALFFAVEREPSNPRQMASVFVLNRTRVMAKKSDTPLDFVNPIRLPNPRIAAQHGLFTLCSREIPIENWVSEAFVGENSAPILYKLVFPLTLQDRKQCILELRDRNITHSTVYPDVQGATDHANRLLREKLEAVQEEPVSKEASEDGDAEIGLAGRPIHLVVERDETGVTKVLAASLASPDRSATPTHPSDAMSWETWRITRVVSGNKNNQPSWKFRAGCAYVLLPASASNRSQPLFLKTPDKRHFLQGRLSDIRGSFTAEAQSLRALAEMEKISAGRDYDDNRELRVAKVLGAVELNCSIARAPSFWPDDGHFPVLIHHFLSGRQTLESALRRRGKIQPAEWLRLAWNLTDTLRRVHNQSVLHAALALRHILVASHSLDKPYIVGFGSSALLSEAGTARASYSRPKSPWLAPEVHETEDLLGPLSFSTDIYSLGVVLLCAATNLGPEDLRLEENRHTFRLKRQVTTLLDRNNPDLAARHDIAKIIDTCLRYEPSERYSCMEELLDAIDAATQEQRTATYAGFTNSVQNLTRAMPERTWDAAHPFFQMLLQRTIDRIQEDLIKKITRGHYEVYGGRNTLIDYLCNFLNLVEDQGVYRTVTLPGYWTDRNLGSDGRFLAKNKELLKRGIVIERVFLVTGPFHTLPYEEQEVLTAHYRAFEQLPSAQKERFRIFVTEKKSAELLQFEKGGQAVAIIASKAGRASGNQSSKPQQAISLRFVSAGKRFQHAGANFIDREIKKLRFKVIAPQSLHREFENMDYKGYERAGVPLSEFVRKDRSSVPHALSPSSTGERVSATPRLMSKKTSSRRRLRAG